MLDVVPSGADAENGAARGDDVEGGDLFGQQSWVAVGHAGDERAERDLVRTSRQGAEERVALEHLVVRAAQAGQLVEVVHHPQRREAAVVGGRGHGRHVLEQAVVGHRERELRQLQSVGRHHWRTLLLWCADVHRRICVLHQEER